MATFTIGDRTFFIRGDGQLGYIHEVLPNRPGTLGPQVCERMQRTGNTLMATADTAKRVIRRHMRLASYDRKKAGE